MWDNIIEYLKDPLLVVKVQNFFGVIYKSSIRNNEGGGEVIHSERLEREMEDSEIRQHKRAPSNISSSSYDTDTSGESAVEETECHINNKFWYWLFVLGTALGDEIFYATFIPFWFWNIDGAVGRRVILVWTVCMYLGQGVKDIVRWPRPGYPVKKLQTKWAIEYGMPSTHAMVGVSIPFSILLYTMDRYEYPVAWGAALAVAWCTLICVSRVYLGMHSVLDIVEAVADTGLIPKALICDQGGTFQRCIKEIQQETRIHLVQNAQTENSLLIANHKLYMFYDPPHLIKCVRNNMLTKDMVFKGKVTKWTDIIEDIFAGLLMASGLLVLLVPLVDQLDGWLLTHQLSPAVVLAVSILVIVYHPNADKWTPTRGDTTMIVSVCAGILAGSWTNYQLGNMTAAPLPPPYEIIWPSIEMLGLTILRTILGFCGVIATRAIGKSVSYAFVCALLGKDKNELRNSEDSLDNKNKIIVELCYKYFTYGMIGFNTTYVFPNVFDLLKINRPTYYTEI